MVGWLVGWLICLFSGWEVDHLKKNISFIISFKKRKSLVCVGVGDGPWDAMHEFDDGLPARRFDNFQFVEFNKIYGNQYSENPDVDFAVNALMEIPEQFADIKKLGLLE